MTPDLITVLRWAGFELELDYDDELVITHPEDIDPKALAEYLGECHGAKIRDTLKARAYWERHQCVGGPFNGRRHGLTWGDIFVLRVRRGAWAAYAVGKDGRAMFAGIASSEAAARRLAKQRA
jgi:hypothetical protein